MTADWPNELGTSNTKTKSYDKTKEQNDEEEEDDDDGLVYHFYYRQDNNKDRSNNANEFISLKSSDANTLETILPGTKEVYPFIISTLLFVAKFLDNACFFLISKTKYFIISGNPNYWRKGLR